MLTPNTWIPLRALTVPAILAFLGLAACGPSEREVVVQPAPGGPSYVLTDDEIAATVSNANIAEIQAAQIALQRSQNSAVRQFAQRMVTDHTQLQQSLSPWAGSVSGIQSGQMTRMGQLSQQVATTGNQTMQTLQQLQGPQFDQTYMDNQVAMHQWLLQTIDNALIPGASSNRLENELKEARPIIASHLQHAQQIRASLPR